MEAARKLARANLTHGGFAAHRDAAAPILLSGAGFAAFERWSFDWLANALTTEGRIVSDLPVSGNPYDVTEPTERVYARLETFLPFLHSPERTRPCYFIVNEVSDALLADVPFASIDADAASPHEITLWIGSGGTRSGLHFDYAHNLLTQIAGRKHVILAPPVAARCLYPRPSNHHSSRVDADEPDLRRFPRFAEATFYEGILGPGEVLYIPPGWWHSIRALEPSISIGCFFGPQLTLRQHFRIIGLGGVRGISWTLRDTLWHGVLRRPYARELYTPVCTGDWLALVLRRKLRDALRGRPSAPEWW